MPLPTPQQLLEQAKQQAAQAAQLKAAHPVPPNTPVGAAQGPTRG